MPKVKKGEGKRRRVSVMCVNIASIRNRCINSYIRNSMDEYEIKWLL